MRRGPGIAGLLALVLTAALAAPASGGADESFVLLAAWGGGEDVGPHVEAIAATDDGSIAVADRKRDRVVVFARERTRAGGFRANDPRGIAAVPGGGYLVAEPGLVRRTDADGNTLARYAADDPYGVALAGDVVLIADASDGRIARYRLDGTRLEPWDAELEAARGIAVGPDGTVYAADAGAWRIETFGADGRHIGGWKVPDPHGVAVGPAGAVYVTSTHFHSLRWFTPAGLPAGSIFGAFVLPRGVAVDCRGTVTIADAATPRLASYGDPSAPPPPCPRPPPSPAGPPPPPPPPPAREEQPRLGQTAAATPLSGAVFVGAGEERHRLTARTIIPVATQVDVTDGRVELAFETAARDGSLQRGVFRDGAFTIHQGTRQSLVELRLVGEAPAAEGAARASRRRKRRRVWGSATGEFRTTGRHGAATVRGTRWLTEDRATGTFIKVAEGSVIAEAFERDERRVVHAGGSFLARPACVSRRNFRIRLRVPVGTAVRSARVTVDGRAVDVSRGARITAPIDLRGLHRRVVRVRIRVVTATGNVMTGTREYRTCVGARGGTPALPVL